MIGTTNLTSTTNRRWYQFSLWHLLVAMTILAVGSSILAQLLAHMRKPEPVEVRGSVRIDGRPLSSGQITFVLMDRMKKQRVSQPVSNGAYAFSDVIESGSYFIEITSPTASGKATVETIPPWYNSETTLRLDLARGTNFADFELSSR